MLNLTESFKLLKGMPLAEWHIVKSESDLGSLDFPYFLKASISGHKTEEKAIFKCNNLEQARENLKQLRKKFPSETIIIQESVDGIEMIIGTKQDQVFGKLLLIGFGGIHAESTKDVQFRALPLNKEEVEKMLKDLKNYKSLVTRKKYSIDKLIKLALEISKLNVKEADFNPVILNESEAVIVDSRILI